MKIVKGNEYILDFAKRREVKVDKLKVGDIETIQDNEFKVVEIISEQKTFSRLIQKAKLEALNDGIHKR